MQIATSRHGDRLVVSPSGRLDSASAPMLEDHLFIAIDEGRHDLVLDLSALDYISSRGLSALLAAAKKVKRVGGRMVLAGLTAHVGEVVFISGFARIFEIYPSIDAALRDG